MAITLGVARETAPGEKRVALTPETCRKFVAAGAGVRIERGLGAHAHCPDEAYVAAGAELGDAARGAADLVRCVPPSSATAIATRRSGAAVVGILQPPSHAARGAGIRARGIVAFPLERLPRTTRAQAMDVLSSQAG